MSITSGFFNSLNGDRKYNAEQMSSIFDGLINDGVYSSIGTAFSVYEHSGNTLSIGIGRAWFNHTWILNDSIHLITLDESEVLLDRIDAIVLDVNHEDSVRSGDIKVVKGVPSSSPINPILIKTQNHNQYPLAYVYRKADSKSITQSNITSMIGTSSCPYVTGIVQVISIDNIVAQWKAQWDDWYNKETESGDEQFTQWLNNKESDFTAWYTALQEFINKDISDKDYLFNTWFENLKVSINKFMTDSQLDFNTWFGNLQAILDKDVAAKLTKDVLDLQDRFKVLAREYSIYDSIDDSYGNAIEDSYDSIVTGQIIYCIK